MSQNVIGMLAFQFQLSVIINEFIFVTNNEIFYNKHI